MSAPPLILLAGMGADERVFAPQRAAFPNLIVPHWIPPLGRESLADYATRMAAAVNPGQPCYVGGISFGGMVAIEMARHLPALGCFLIASVRAPHELPWHLRVLRPLAVHAPRLLFHLMISLGGLSLWSAGSLLRPNARQLIRQLSNADATFLRWVTVAALSWRPTNEPPGVPIRHLHGDRDRILPIRHCHSVTVVHAGGHVLTLTHPTEVNKFLQAGLVGSATGATLREEEAYEEGE